MELATTDLHELTTSAPPDLPMARDRQPFPEPVIAAIIKSIALGTPTTTTTTTSTCTMNPLHMPPSLDSHA